MFRKKDKQPAAVASPKKGPLIRPPGFSDTAAADSVPLEYNSATGAKTSPVKSPRAVIKPPSLSLNNDDDTAQTQQEFALGKKGILRPMVSPMHEAPKQDFFARFSYRKAAPPHAPEPLLTRPSVASPSIDQDDNYSESGSISSTAVPHTLEDESEDDVIARIAERRGWGTTLPSTNPHVMHALLKESNPFKRIRNFEHATASELVHSVETNIYATAKAMTVASKARFHSGDIVVCGTPRSGQTPLLRVLDALKKKELRPRSAIIHAATWVEGPFRAVDSSGGRKLFKTHIALSHILRGDTGKSIVQHKIIVMLRDPADSRLSWYRHIRMLAKKCGKANIDDRIGAAQFTDTYMPCPLLPKHPKHDLHGKEPEYFINAALRAKQEFPENVLVLFYEELFSDPLKFVEKIAKFTNYMEVEEAPRRDAESGDETKISEKKSEIKRKEQQELVHAIASGLINDTLHPNSGRRNGSSNQGTACFTTASLEQMDVIWDQIVQPIFTSSARMASYMQLFQTETREKYPFAPNKSTAGSSLLGRLSNLTTGSNGSEGKKKDNAAAGYQSDSQGTTRLRKKDSTESGFSMASSTIVTPRKFGGSFLKLIGGGSSHSGPSDASTLAAGDEGFGKILVTTLPKPVVTIDPDDSDDEYGLRGISHMVEE